MLGHTPIDTHMELEPKDLGIPLHPRRRGVSLWLCLLCAGLAWLWHRPTQWAAIALSCVLGGAILWVAVQVGWQRFKRRRAGRGRWLVVLATWLVAGVAMTWLMPFLHRQVS